MEEVLIMQNLVKANNFLLTRSTMDYFKIQDNPAMASKPKGNFLYLLCRLQQNVRPCVFCKKGLSALKWNSLKDTCNYIVTLK